MTKQNEHLDLWIDCQVMRFGEQCSKAYIEATDNTIKLLTLMLEQLVSERTK